MNYLREKRELGLFATIALIFLAPASPVSAAVPGERSGGSGLVNVIFDTDVCLDIDDPMALAMVHALHDRHEANLVAVTVSLDEKSCAAYVSALNTFYGHADVPIGAIRNGLSIKVASEKIKKGTGHQWEIEKLLPSTTFAQSILDRKNPDGLPTYPHRLIAGSQVPEAVSLLRKTLAAQSDGSVVMIQVGNSGNFAALLDSRRDAISDLSGLELIKRKVRLLSVMAATFNQPKGSPGTGINFYEDVPSAQTVFSKWPTLIVVSGTEIGGEIKFLGASIARDFSYVPDHPIEESYRYFCDVFTTAFPTVFSHSYSPTSKCPHDHHTLDLTATLYALRPDRNYFSLSKPGKITVLPSGNIRFDEEKNGNHRYLIVSEEQKIRAQEAMIMLVSQPPLKR